MSIASAAATITDLDPLRRGTMATATLDTTTIVDWDTFHAASREAFGFPDFYGRNMDAWIDCLTYLDADNGMSRFALAAGETLCVEVRGAESFAERMPELALALMTATAAINGRHIEDGKPPMLMLLLM
jgi:Barstar (barnase inhibitor)